jgi:hypothetical protein
MRKMAKSIAIVLAEKLKGIKRELIDKDEKNK